MTDDTIAAFNPIVWKLSHYEDGKRWCDFCGVVVDHRDPQNSTHNPECPVHRVYRVLEMEPRENQDDLIGEVNRRRGEMAVARDALNEANVPAGEDGITWTMSQRIRALAYRSVYRLRALERAASYLRRMYPMHDDSCVCERCGLLRFVQAAIDVK